MQNSVQEQYASLTKYLIKNKLTISTMESITGGMLSSLITDTEGASAVLKGAFVTYANEAKIKQGVYKDVIDAYGVYSCATAEAMAKACQAAYESDIGIGVTGTAGNIDLNNSDSERGVVYIAIAIGKHIVSQKYTMPQLASRLEYKLCTAQYAYDLLVRTLAIQLD